MKLATLLCLLVVCVSVPVQGFIEKYPYSVVLSKNSGGSPQYSVYWRVDSGYIYLGLQVNSTGWIGFGLGEPTSGSMPGADFFVADFHEDGTLANTYDRFAETYTAPLIDKCQDWSVSNYQKPTDQDSYFEVEISRPLTTGDPQDRDILPGPTKILWAYGSQHELSYHGKTRGVNSITFINGTTIQPNDLDTFTVLFPMPNITIPNATTTYMCYAIPISPSLPNSTTDYHAIKFETLVNPAHTHIVHHSLLHSCEYGETVQRFLQPTPCFSPVGSGGCNGLAYAWAVGGYPLYLPLEAGIRVGASAEAWKWFVLEIHYDNAKNENGLIDNSGMLVTFTPHLRKHDAATLLLGNIGTDEEDLPPGQTVIKREADCPSACTERWSHEINVFGDFLHMHQAGRSIWSTVHRGGNRLPGYLNRIEYWQFSFQDYIPMQRVLRPGDHINTVCLYDTASKSQPVLFGEASSMEMCLQFVAYYPKLRDFYVCGSTKGRYKYINGQFYPASKPGERDYSTVCYTVPLDSDNYSLVNPSIPDPSGDEVRQFGRLLSECPATNGSVFHWTIIWILTGVAIFLLVLCVVLFATKNLSNGYLPVARE